jgi:hypothetical protein
MAGFFVPGAPGRVPAGQGPAEEGAQAARGCRDQERRLRANSARD